MRKLIVILLVVLMAFCSSRSKADVPKSEYVYQTLALVDMMTTLDIKRHPGIAETNPILGRHPSDAKVLGYFALEGVAHFMVTKTLVDRGWTKTATAWEYVSIGVEAGCIVNNYHLGLQTRF